MKLLLTFIIILCLLCPVGLQPSFSQNTITNESNDNISNFNELKKSSQDINNSFPGKYDSDQINEIIYGLYKDYLHSDKNDIAHYHYIAILIDFICSNKFYENNIEACDMDTEFPIE